MRWILVLLILGAAALYFTVGIRVGILPQTPAYYANAVGTNVYPVSVRTPEAQIDVRYEFRVNSGELEVRLVSQGRELWRERARPGRTVRGRQSFPVDGGAGISRIELRLDGVTGAVNLDWTVREGL